MKHVLELHDAWSDADSGASDDVETDWEEDVRARRRKVRWTVQQARETYEHNWEAISKSSHPLSFSSIPWPVFARPSGPSSMTKDEIAAFVLGTRPGHARAKERVKNALKRWHPDKFARFSERVDSSEREKVLEAAGNVARCLNELL